MFCNSCGAQINDDAVFCPECGAVQEQKNAHKAAASKAAASTPSSKHTDSVQQAFMDPDETLLASLGNGYFVNLLFNRMKKCSALLSNKRVYLKGTMYAGQGKTLLKTIEERTLDLEDITGTGFVYTRYSKIMIIIGILIELFSIYAGVVSGEGSAVLLGLIPCLVLIVAAFLSRKIWFFIDYAGGKIQIDAKLIGLSDVQDFHKQIRRAKDAVKGKE